MLPGRLPSPKDPLHQSMVDRNAFDGLEQVKSNARDGSCWDHDAGHPKSKTNSSPALQPVVVTFGCSSCAGSKAGVGVSNAAADSMRGARASHKVVLVEHVERRDR
eukprot:1623714-Rhodomonas_salina.1